MIKLGSYLRELPSLDYLPALPNSFTPFLNPFASLSCDAPDDDNKMASSPLDAHEHTNVSEVEQHRFEIRAKRQAAVTDLHNSFGRPHTQALLHHCRHEKIGTKHLKQYILSLEYAFCQAALGRRSYIKKQRTALPLPAILPDPSAASAPIPDVFLHSFRGSRRILLPSPTRLSQHYYGSVIQGTRYLHCWP